MLCNLQKGKHRADAKTSESESDIIKLTKSNDLNYAISKQTSEKAKIEKLQSSLNFLSEKPSNKHTIFVDSVDEAKDFKPEVYFDTVPELAERAFNRPRIETLRTTEVIGPKGKKELTKVRQLRENSYRELSERIDREGKISKVVAHLQLQKNLLGKGKRKKVQSEEGDAPAQYVWKKQRKS